jgi:transcription antitermination factor NusG
LVGSKLDLDEERKVSKLEVEEFGRRIKIAGVTEVSAKNGQNVK